MLGKVVKGYGHVKDMNGALAACKDGNDNEELHMLII